MKNHERALDPADPPVNLTATQNDRPQAVDYFGGCPECGYHDGYINIGGNHWFICHEHRTRWCAGSNLFSSWLEQADDQWRQNAILLEPYADVEPLYPPDAGSPRPALPTALILALEAVLNGCTPAAQAEYLSLPETQRTGHHCESLATVYGWLNGIVEPVRWMRMQLGLHRTRQTADGVEW